MNKLTFLYLLAVLLSALAGKAQVTGLIANLETDLLNYTVTAQDDTTFNRKVVMIVPDTTAIQYITATLTELDSGTWQGRLSNSSNPPSAADTTPCSTPLCIYRENENRWILYIGNYSLMRRYKITLYFNHHTNPDWTLEF
jgi:hypothetical protein